jgi:hypothetical protein
MLDTMKDVQYKFGDKELRPNIPFHQKSLKLNKKIDGLFIRD